MEILTKNTYEKIAHDFSNTRYSVWGTPNKFLSEICYDELGLEVGCGNGKNMEWAKKKYKLNIIGCDNCEKFINICKKKDLDVFLADMLDIKIKAKSFNYILSIAVIHHLSTLKLRIKALRELIRLGTKGAKYCISVWAFEQEEGAKRHFTTQDELVPWKCRIDNKIYYRYYHLYKIDELLNELYIAAGDINIINYIYEEGNYFVIFTI